MVNIGIIGLGYWGPNILRNLTKVYDSNVTYCCDINPSRYDQIKKIYPWIKYTKDSNEIINSSDVDAVAIVTPVNTHYNLVKDALEADKHVLVSKPLTDNISSAEELVEISNKKNLVLHVDHTFLFHPAVNKIKKIISKGELGELYYIDSIRINLGLFQHDISVIWDLAPHDVSIMQYLVEQPVEWVQATGACHAGQDFESMAYMQKMQIYILSDYGHISFKKPS